jgi:hypothetical protein
MLVILAMMEARPRTTPRSHRLLSLHLLLLWCREPFPHRLPKRLLDPDHLWTPHVHHHRRHPKETRPCLMEETTILIATTRPASHRLLPLALSPLVPRQSLRGSLSTQETTTIAQMTCTQLLHHGDRLSVRRHHHLVLLSNRRQCLQCHSPPLHHGRHQDSPSMCHELL